MDILGLIKVLVWPCVALLLGVLALFLFKKPLTRRIEQLKKADLKKRSFEFGDSPIDISAKEKLTAKKDEVVSVELEDTVNWNKSGALYWLGHDLMWTIDALMRGADRPIIIHGLKQSLLNLQEVGFTGTTMESGLQRMLNDAIDSKEKDWHQVRRNWASIELRSIIDSIGKLAVDNQPGFKHRPDD